jgi:probable addiction module antidote protein
MNKFSSFDIADHSDSQEMIAGFLADALSDDDPEVFIAALSCVAKARRMSDIAKKTGLNRESLYKAMKPGSKLRFETVQKVIGCFGLRLTVTADPSGPDGVTDSGVPLNSNRQRSLQQV